MGSTQVLKARDQSVLLFPSNSFSNSFSYLSCSLFCLAPNNLLQSLSIATKYALMHICDWACKSNHRNAKKSPMLSSLFYHNLPTNGTNKIATIFITIAEFDGLSSKVYTNGILLSQLKILAKIYVTLCNLHTWFIFQARSHVIRISTA